MKESTAKILDGFTSYIPWLNPILVKNNKDTHTIMLHLLPVELGETFPQLHERGLHTGVVGQGQQGVGVAHGRHRTQARLPALLVPRDKGQRGLQSRAGRMRGVSQSVHGAPQAMKTIHMSQWWCFRAIAGKERKRKRNQSHRKQVIF